jgi:HSP20 family protein
MSLFPRFSSSIYAPFENDFRSLFRLMDNVSSRYENSLPTSTSVRAFAPRFDVEEKENAYYLHGELPGIDQKDIEIEFTDAHTLVVKGSTESHIERREGDARVTDTAQEASAQNGQAQPTSQSTSMVSTGAGNKELAQGGQNDSKWWVSERTSGEFYRSFSFPSRVDQDGVKANLSKGVLSIMVPKAVQKKSQKKIAIENVE